MRRAARRDANHGEVVSAILGAGWSWADTASCGNGIPDGFASIPGFACAVEIKDGDKPPSERKLTPDQQKFAEAWTGPYVVVTGPSDAVEKLWQCWKGLSGS